MITFESQEDFENAVMCVIVDKLRLRVQTSGQPFLTNVSVALKHKDDPYGVLTEHSDGCY